MKDNGNAGLTKIEIDEDGLLNQIVEEDFKTAQKLTKKQKNSIILNVVVCIFWLVVALREIVNNENCFYSFVIFGLMFLFGINTYLDFKYKNLTSFYTDIQDEVIEQQHKEIEILRKEK